MSTDWREVLKDTGRLGVLFLAAAWPTTAAIATISPRVAWITLGVSLLLLLATWWLYAEAMRLKRLRDRGDIKLWHYPWAVVILGIGLTLDAVANLIVGAYWREAPRWGDGEILLTARLERWAHDDSNPERQAFAWRVCKKLNKHDYRHCFDGTWEPEE